VHTITANVIFGVLANAARMDIASDRVDTQLSLLWHALLERKNIHSSSAMVKVGRGCSIDPTAVIKGPTIIGDNVSIGAGAVIDISVIGDNVNIMQGCQVQWSVISDRGYLPFRAAVFSSVIMADSMVAQNTCVQFCSIGRNTFLGAGNTFTDFNLVPKPIRTLHQGELANSGMAVLGGCVGHNCFIGSGMVIYPARVIESDVVLVASEKRRVIDRNVYYEESDHFNIKEGIEAHQRQNPR
jgi:NDP-sugar pyrophosphorylase family protein